MLKQLTMPCSHRAALAIRDMDLVPTQISLDILHLLLRLRIQGIDWEERNEQRQKYMYLHRSFIEFIPILTCRLTTYNCIRETNRSVPRIGILVN